jgi:isochorismate synthase
VVILKYGEQQTMKSVLGAAFASSNLKVQRHELLEWALGAVSQGFSESRKEGRPMLHVVSKRLDLKAPPLALLDSPIEDVHFFGNRDRFLLGVGTASEYESPSPASLSDRNARKALGLDNASPSAASRVCIMGGWPFSPPSPRKGGNAWRDFPRSRWVIPALILSCEDGRTTVTLAVLASPRPGREARATAYHTCLVGDLLVAERFMEEGAQRTTSPALSRVFDVPSERTWLKTAREAVDSISKANLKKVVLSRSVRLLFDGELQPSAVSSRLLTLNPTSTVFAVKRRRSVFLGATPESLLSIDDGKVEIDCLAASAPRGRDEAEDASLGAGLLADAKSREEHELVVQAAVRSISPFISRIELARSPTLKRLPSIQHLYTPIKAHLLADQDIWAVALSLWPSPAIAGEPKPKAIRWIRATERFNRGWFAGVVGCLQGDFQSGRLVIGIRSGLLRKNEAVIYAGAGLVAGSDPKKEFEETGWKLETMMRSLSQELADS